MSDHMEEVLIFGRSGMDIHGHYCGKCGLLDTQKSEQLFARSLDRKYVVGAKERCV